MAQRGAVLAIWQFTFHLVPRAAVERLHGPSILVLAGFSPFDPETWGEGKELPNYWEGHSPRSFAAAMKGLLPPHNSWSSDAVMFGNDDSDDIELWEDDIRVRLDMREFNFQLAQAVVGFAAANDLVLVMGETGRVMPPAYDKLAREIGNSRSARFVANPVETLRMIGREHE